MHKDGPKSVGKGATMKYEVAQAEAVQALTNPKTALQFIMAGNAYFTVRSIKTGMRYTFHVRSNEKSENNNWKAMHFVSLLTGPENTADYTYMGAIRDRVFRLTKASRYTEDSLPVKAFHWVFDHLNNKITPPFTEIWHEGRCGRCGRMLTVPESIAAGIGPECAGRMGM